MIFLCVDMSLTSLLIKGNQKPTTVHACSYILDLTLELINIIFLTSTSNQQFYHLYNDI